MYALLFLIVAFFALSGTLAAVDASVLSVTRPEVEELILHRKRGARKLKLVQQELTRAVVVIVILTNTVNVLGPILISQQTVRSIGSAALGGIAIALTLGTIVFSEIIPKAIGTHYAPDISRFAAGPIRFLQFAAYPLVVILERLSALFTTGTRKIGTETQIRSLTTIGRRAGFIEADEGRLVHRAFVLNDRSAADIMTPLDSVVSLNASQSIGTAVTTARESMYSRFPVIGESADDVVGVVIIRELLEAAADDKDTQPLKSLIRPAILVRSDVRSDDLLLMFRKRRSHLAVVRNCGRTVGVVTLEDVLEELVGEIEDETDVAHSPDT